MDYARAFFNSRPGCRPSGVLLIRFFFTNFNISSVFCIKDTLLSYNNSGLHSQTPRPGAVEGLDYARKSSSITTLPNYIEQN